VILHLQLDTSALARHQHASEHTGLYPNLATLTYDKSFRCWPRIKTQSGVVVVGVPLQNVNRALVSDESVLVFPGDAHCCADLVSYPSKAVSEVDRRRGGGRKRETEEEGRKSAPGTVVMRG
jgi:hypothetical protein